jgi:hypothetical protein
MNVFAADVSLTDALAHLHTALDEISAATLTGCTDAEVLAACRAMESSRRPTSPSTMR